LTKETVGDNITAYSYDLAGNRIGLAQRHGETQSNIDYTLGIGNRLASWGDNGEAHYNTAGCLTNMVSDVDGRELNLSWDGRYQLESVRLKGTSEKDVLSCDNFTLFEGKRTRHGR